MLFNGLVSREDSINTISKNVHFCNHKQNAQESASPFLDQCFRMDRVEMSKNKYENLNNQIKCGGNNQVLENCSRIMSKYS